MASLLERVLVPENNTNGSAPGTRVPSPLQTASRLCARESPKSMLGHTATHVLMSSRNAYCARTHRADLLEHTNCPGATEALISAEHVQPRALLCSRTVPARHPTPNEAAASARTVFGGERPTPPSDRKSGQV